MHGDITVEATEEPYNEEGLSAEDEFSLRNAVAFLKDAAEYILLAYDNVKDAYRHVAEKVVDDELSKYVSEEIEKLSDRLEDSVSGGYPTTVIRPGVASISAVREVIEDLIGEAKTEEVWPEKSAFRGQR